MGMYDSIKCERKLPLDKELKSLDVNWQQVTFQTKSLDNCLGEYKIKKNGNLIEEVTEYEYSYFTKEERSSKNPPKPWEIIKDQKIVGQSKKTVDYHGKIIFYEIFEFSELEDVWVEFVAYFVYGKLDKIELLKKEKVKSRELSNKEFFDKIKAEKDKAPFKFKMFLTRFGWNTVFRLISRSLYKISSIFSKAAMFINSRMIF